MYQKKRINELNYYCFACIRDFACRDASLASKTFNVPVEFLKHIKDMSDDDIRQFLVDINVPIFGAVTTTEKEWQVMTKEISVPEKYRNKVRLNTVLLGRK